MENKIFEINKIVKDINSKPISRILRKPFFYIFGMLFIRIYNYILNSKPIVVSRKLFFGDKMKMVLPEDLSLFYWGLIPGAELNLTSFFGKNMKNGDNVIDIGANHGFYTLFFRYLVGENGKVFAFEPTPTTLDILRDNTSKYSNIFIAPFAVWSKKEIIKFTDFGIGLSAYNSFLNNVPSEEASASKNINFINVEAVTLDSYIEDNNIKPDFIKLDVEGAEYEALLGMQETLKKYNLIISVEFWVNNLWTESNNKVLSFLESLNYFGYIIDEEGELFKYDYRKNFPRDYTNLIFKKNE